MYRYLIAILVVAGLGYWTHSWWQDHLASERAQQAKEAQRQALRKSVLEMASKVNAVTNWAAKLADDRMTRESPVLTVELQEQWLVDRPILLIGNFEDAAMNQDGTYQIIVEHHSIGGHMFLQNNIRVSLRCPESITIPLIQAVRAKRTSPLFADTAITAVIERIVRTSEKDSEGDTISVLTGVGKCVSAMHLTERISWR